MTTKRVIDHSAEYDSTQRLPGGGSSLRIPGGGAKVTVRELIRQLQTLPGDYVLWLTDESANGASPVWYVDVDHETQEVTFG